MGSAAGEEISQGDAGALGERYFDFMPEVPSFPEGFLWGATTGSHQTEGNNTASGWWGAGERARLAHRRAVGRRGG
jgi:hypothetical protein